MLPGCTTMRSCTSFAEIFPAALTVTSKLKGIVISVQGLFLPDHYGNLLSRSETYCMLHEGGGGRFL